MTIIKDKKIYQRKFQKWQDLFFIYDEDSNNKITKHIFAPSTGSGQATDILVADITSGTPLGGTTPSCAPLETGDWTISTSCIFTGSALAPASVIVTAGKLLTLSPNSKLLIDFKHYKLLVKHIGGVLIKKGSTLRQVKTSDIDTAPTISYILTDHLNSANVVTDSTGIQKELLDYYPYGSIRLDQKTGSFSEQRKYIGQEYGEATSLSYLNARYYDGKRGQFILEDPQFWNFDQAWLMDPQNQNSYSYARNNPVTLSDPTGKSILGDLFGGAKTAYAPSEININYQRINNTTFSVPLRDNNISVKTGKITGDVYSLVKNQGITINKTNHNVNDGKKATSLDGVQSSTILGAIDFKQQCNCPTMITGGTEKGEGSNKVHGPDHWDGFKLDFGLNNKINNFVQNNYTRGSNRIDRDGTSNPRYYDNTGNVYVNEIGKNHWDTLFNQNYKYNGYSIK